MRVLYVNHTSHISGGERSLLTFLRALPDDIQPLVACPSGPLAEALREQAIEPLPVRGTEGSLRLHPLRTTRAVGEMLSAAGMVRRLARENHVDLIHANSIRAGLVACGATRGRGAAVVTHVRDCLPAGATSNLVRQLVAGASDVVLANSRYTAERFAIPKMRSAVCVAHSPVDLDRFRPDAVNRSTARQRLGIPATAPAVGVVAQLTPWKGQEEAIRAVAEASRKEPELRLLLAGEAKFVGAATRYDNRTYVRRLRSLVSELGLGDRVEFLGERDDVPAMLRALDVVLVPSWEEPFGRSVVEAMAMGLPVIATSIGGPAEIIGDGEGVLLPPRDPASWGARLTELLANPRHRAEMGGRARSRVIERFGIDAHVGAVRAAYATALGSAQRSTFSS